MVVRLCVRSPLQTRERRVLSVMWCGLARIGPEREAVLRTESYERTCWGAEECKDEWTRANGVLRKYSLCRKTAVSDVDGCTISLCWIHVAVNLPWQNTLLDNSDYLSACQKPSLGNWWRPFFSICCHVESVDKSCFQTFKDMPILCILLSCHRFWMLFVPVYTRTVVTTEDNEVMAS